MKYTGLVEAINRKCSGTQKISRVETIKCIRRVSGKLNFWGFTR